MREDGKVIQSSEEETLDMVNQSESLIMDQLECTETTVSCNNGELSVVNTL